MDLSASKILIQDFIRSPEFTIFTGSVALCGISSETSNA